MILGVFCRQNHPGGYAAGYIPPGTPPALAAQMKPHAEQAPYTGAHGYVTLVVACDDWVEYRAVRDRLRRWFQWKGRDDAWYAGLFDPVWACEGWWQQREALGSDASSFPLGMWRSIGDNRACAYLAAGEVLHEPERLNA